MFTWAEFAHARPDLAKAGCDLICQYGVGLAFLSTVRPDGGPRLHPIAPLITDESLFGFIVRSPKLGDLRRDGRFALHSYPLADNEDAFYLTGRARTIDDNGAFAAAARAFVAQPGRIGPPPNFEGQALVEFLIETCLLTRTSGHGDPEPRHTIWKAGL